MAVEIIIRLPVKDQMLQHSMEISWTKAIKAVITGSRFPRGESITKTQRDRKTYLPEKKVNEHHSKAPSAQQVK